MTGCLTQTYKERIVFTPIWGLVRNRGFESADHINPACAGDQTLAGVRYSQRVVQTSRSDDDGSCNVLWGRGVREDASFR